MNPAVTQPPAAPPDDPVRAALDDAKLQDKLLNHALAVLGRRLAGRMGADRLDKAKEAGCETCVRASCKHVGLRPQTGRWVHGFMGLWLTCCVRQLGRSDAFRPRSRRTRLHGSRSLSIARLARLTPCRSAWMRPTAWRSCRPNIGRCCNFASMTA